MRKFLLLLFATVVFGAVASAAPNCLSTQSVATMIGYLAEGCMSGDKIYSNFTLSGSGTLESGTLEVQINDLGDLHTIQIGRQNGQHSNAVLRAGESLTFSYTFSIAPEFVNYRRIVSASGDTTAPVTCNGKGECTLSKTVTGDASFSLFSENGSQETKSGLQVISLNISASAAVVGGGGGQIQSISDSYLQQTIPEPGTYALMGGGLMALALLRRRKKA